MRPLVLFALLAAQSFAQLPSVALEPPYGPDHKLVSPNGSYALYGLDQPAQLRLEDLRTHQSKLVFRVTVQTLTLAWSPDGTAFIANDRASSDLEFAYIFDVNTLHHLDLRSRILAAHPAAARFAPGPNTAPHSYCHAIRWLDARHVEVALHGHTDGVRISDSVHPGDCFDLRYRVSRDGAVEKLSQRVSPVTSKGCEEIE